MHQSSVLLFAFGSLNAIVHIRLGISAFKVSLNTPVPVLLPLLAILACIPLDKAMPFPSIQDFSYNEIPGKMFPWRQVHIWEKKNNKEKAMLSLVKVLIPSKMNLNLNQHILVPGRWYDLT
jgi:hypothetical protein